MPKRPTFEDVACGYASFIRRTLAHLGIAAADLPDIEQEVLRGVDRGLPAFDPSRSDSPETALRGWIYGICERQAASHRRGEAKRRETVCVAKELDGRASPALDAEAQMLEAERMDLLSALLGRLEEKRRAVVVAYELDGVPMVHVARQLGIPLNTAWNRLRLGREDLRGEWRRMKSHGAPARPAPAPDFAAPSLAFRPGVTYRAARGCAHRRPGENPWRSCSRPRV